MKADEKLNIHSRSTDARGKMLSPLTNRPFRFENHWFSSFEGFYAGIKYPEHSTKRHEAFASTAGYAQRLGMSSSDTYAWWRGHTILLGSIEHLSLVKAAHFASVLGNADRKEALIATQGLFLTHDMETGADPHYPPKQFCADLMELRALLLLQ